jgi:MSHA biogenesis protein MshM
MYYSHFGLNQAPFKITPNTEFFFSGGNRGPILEALIYAVCHGEGIIKVTGEVGSGKTMLCNMLPARLPPSIETVYIANPSVSPDEILHTIAFELQLGLAQGASRLEAMQALQAHLLKRHADGRRVVVFVEESQGMPLATLEEIRLLSNLETKNDKLLQIVLFGQPELDENLSRPDIRQLRDRIAHSFRLEPLGEGEVREYLMFRLRAAGYRGPDLFPPAVVKRIARASDGLTRRINLIADKALLAAFSENTHTIKPKHVEAAVRDSEFSRHAAPRLQPRYAWAAALLLTGAALGAIAYALVERSNRGTDAATAAPGTSNAAAAKAVSGAQTSSPVTNGNSGDKEISIKTNTYEKPPAGFAEAPPPASKPATATVAQTAPTTSAAAIATDDIIQQRLGATREWLAREAPGTFSIQLLGTNDEEQLKHHLNVLGKFIEINEVFVYRTSVQQKPLTTILYGSFSSHRAAQEALDKLPPFLKTNRPILRTVQGVRTEIQQQQNS